MMVCITLSEEHLQVCPKCLGTGKILKDHISAPWGICLTCGHPLPPPSSCAHVCQPIWKQP